MYDLSKKPTNGVTKKWYKKNRKDIYKKVHKEYILRKIGHIEMPLLLDFLKWIIIDCIRGKWKIKKKTGIYQFVALPGEGKTLSMVNHIEKCKEQYPTTRVYTNFNYKEQDGNISHWSDMIKHSKDCVNDNVPCILALDEIHITFDSSDWRSFPAEMLALLSFNRKFGVQFLCSSQIYERIPKKVRDIANYTVICKNVLKLDRMFINYYFNTNNYEAQFEGKRAKADFTRHYIASDDLYAKYNTLQQVDRMILNVAAEKSKKEQAFNVLFGDNRDEDTPSIVA